MDPSKLMVGGAKFQQQVLEWTKQSNHLYMTVMFSVIFMLAVYADKLPLEWRWQMSTIVGRLLLLLLLYIVNMLAGWAPALLFTIAIALIWANRPLYKPVGMPEREGFNDIKVTDVKKEKWFVEKVLNEDPQRIVQDRVTTFPVQEDGPAGSSRTSK